MSKERMVRIHDLERTVGGKLNGKNKSEKANQKTEDPDAIGKSGSEKLAGAEGNRNRTSCSEPRIGEGKNRKEIADVSENKKPIRRK